MPVTRSSSRQASGQHHNQPYASRRADPSESGDSKKAKPPSNDIIVLSSDDDEPSPKGISASKKSLARTARRKAAPPTHSDGVLEISSDDETRPKKTTARRQTRSSTEQTNKDFERTIKQLREELERQNQLLVSTSLEMEELKRDGSHKGVLTRLEEYTPCEVCSHTMWCPYILPECGHSFCERCLVNWFSTIQAQHLTANPQLDDNRTALAGQLHAFVRMVPNLHTYGLHGQQHVRAILGELRRHRPEYTCPSCRKEVLNKPMEDFRLKGLVKEIATMLGETEKTQEDVSVHRGTGPFDDFFCSTHIR